MKKLIFTAALLISCVSIQVAKAQIGFSLNLNIGSQPDWGPVGYDHADYYYLPDVDAYYDVPTHQYVYYENNIWVHRAYLPARYRGYNLYNGYKVVINRPNPWLRHTYYRNNYASYRGRSGQAIIRDSRDAKYRQHWNGNNGRGPIGRPGHGPIVRPGRGPGNDHHDNGNHGGGRGPGEHGGGRPGGEHGGGHGPGGGDHGGHGPGGEHGGGHGHH